MKFSVETLSNQRVWKERKKQVFVWVHQAVKINESRFECQKGKPYDRAIN